MRSLVYAFFILLVSAGGAFGQPSREGLPISQVQIFQRMLFQAEEGNFDSVQKSTLFLDPLLSDFQAKFGINMKAGIQDKIARKDKAGLESDVLHLVFLDMSDLFQIAGEQLKEKKLENAKVKIRTAYQDYLILSPSMSEKAFPADQKIKNDFRILTLGTELTLRPEEYLRLTAEVQQLIVSAYPGYKMK